MGASNSKNDRCRKASYDNDDTPRKRRKEDTYDELAERQSVMSSVKIEGKPVHSSPEVLELRQYLLMAKQAQINAEQLVINTAQQLLDTEQQAARKEEEYQSEIREAALRAERAEKELVSTRGFEQKAKELERKVNILEDDKKRAYQLINTLTNEVEDEKRRAREKEKTLETRIELLKRILAGGEAGEAGVAESAIEVVDHRLDNVAHATNILRLLKPTAHNAIFIDEAEPWVRASFEQCGKKAQKRCGEKPSTFDCLVCGVNTLNKLAVTTHFLSEEHIGKVRASGAKVSRAAVSNWANMLDNFAHWEKSRKGDPYGNEIVSL